MCGIAIENSYLELLKIDTYWSHTTTQAIGQASFQEPSPPGNLECETWTVGFNALSFKARSLVLKRNDNRRLFGFFMTCLYMEFYPSIFEFIYSGNIYIAIC